MKYTVKEFFEVDLVNLKNTVDEWYNKLDSSLPIDYDLMKRDFLKEKDRIDVGISRLRSNGLLC